VKRNSIQQLPTVFLLISLWYFAFAGAILASDWSRFRGPDGTGLAERADLPVRFSLSQGVKWRTPIDGKGWSSPVVGNGRVWLTTAVTEEPTEEQKKQRLANVQPGDTKEVAGVVHLYAVCIDAESGAVLHNLLLATVTEPQPINPLNTYASPTPVLDDQRVYCHFGTYGTWCLDTQSGDVLWHETIQLDHSVGPGCSPIVVDNKLILVCDGIDQQFVIALDKQTGKTAWKTDRPAMRAGNVEMKKAYSTPILIDVNGQKQIVAPGAQWIVAYEPSTGQEIWRADHGDGFSLSPSPIYSNGLVIFSTGYMRPELVAVRVDGQGDVTASHIAWRASRGAPAKPSPVVVGDSVFMIADNGVLTQLNCLDGKEIHRERLNGNFSASLLATSDKIYALSHEGIVTVLSADSEMKKIAENQLEGSLMASPAVIGNDLLIRTEQALVRIGK
jgi:outer membrane protein assembly factor BamB